MVSLRREAEQHPVEGEVQQHQRPIVRRNMLRGRGAPEIHREELGDAGEGPGEPVLQNQQVVIPDKVKPQRLGEDQEDNGQHQQTEGHLTVVHRPRRQESLLTSAARIELSGQRRCALLSRCAASSESPSSRRRSTTSAAASGVSG